MLTRALTVICVAATLAIPVNAAQAGILGNAAKVVKLSAKLNGTILKSTAKVGLAAARIGVGTNVALAKCLVKAATSKPCI